MHAIRLLLITLINMSCGQSEGVPVVAMSPGPVSPFLTPITLDCFTTSPGLISSANLIVPPPALQTAISILPSFFTISVIAVSVAARSVRSTSKPIALTPSVLPSSMTVGAAICFFSNSYTSNPFRFLSMMAMSAPSLASRRAQPLPMPRAPPVTKATLPDNFFSTIMCPPYYNLEVDSVIFFISL